MSRQSERAAARKRQSSGEKAPLSAAHEDLEVGAVTELQLPQYRVRLKVLPLGRCKATVQRHDGAAMDWAERYRAKNMIFGAARLALQFFSPSGSVPSESVAELWALAPNEAFGLSLGQRQRPGQGKPPRVERRVHVVEQRRLMAPVLAAMQGAWTPWSDVPLTNAPRSVTAAFTNNYYVVQLVPELSDVTRLMVRRNDASTEVSMADKQRIKNELCAANRIGLEVFPPAAELIDDANMYHLWVMPPGVQLSFGPKLAGEDPDEGGSNG